MISNQVSECAKFTLGYIKDIYIKYFLPTFLTNKRGPAIASAAAIVLLYMAYDKLFSPPRAIRHIPYIPYFSFLKSLLQSTSIAEHNEAFVFPIINQKNTNGIFSHPGIFGWEVAVANPAAIKKIMLKIDAFPKADVIRTTEHTIISRFLRGPNLVFSNGSSWKTQRKIANPAFHRSLPVKLFGDMAKKMFQVMDKQDSLVDITDLMERWTLDVIGEAGFGFRFNAVEDPTNNWVQLYKNISNGVNDPFWFFFTNLETNFLWLFPKRQRTHRELDTFLEMLDDVIVKKRADIASNNKNPHLQENEKDLLTLLIEASKEGSGSLSDQELMSNLCAFFVAGHDTTANALSFTIYYLAKNPDIQQKAREEAISILGEDQDTIPTIEQTKEIDYINMVIKETLRMNSPAVSAITRISTEDTELDGVFIPKGALVVPDIYALHHNPTIWHNPEEFNPERFVPGGEAERLSGAGMCWIPFGSGARQCIGMNFSLAEQRVMLSLMLRKYTWSLPEDSIHKNMLQATKIGVMVAHDLNIVFKRRY